MIHLSGLVVCLTLFQSVDLRSEQALTRFEAVWDKVKSLEYVLAKTERMRDGTLRDEKVLVKFAKPGRFYITGLEPRHGQEILYDSSKRPKELLVHPGRFPDLTLWLDIHGRIATANQHHPISHGGYGYLWEHLVHLLTTAREQPLEVDIGHGGVTEFMDEPVERVEIVAKTRAARPLVARRGESLFAFADRVRMDPYRILMANPTISGLSANLKEGRSYDVPWYYADRMEILLDPKTGFIRRYRCWNEAGQLYEDYQFQAIIVDPKLTQRDFDPSNPAYRF